jgi:hypothetical protein
MIDTNDRLLSQRVLSLATASSTSIDLVLCEAVVGAGEEFRTGGGSRSTFASMAALAKTGTEPVGLMGDMSEYCRRLGGFFSDRSSLERRLWTVCSNEFKLATLGLLKLL